MKRESYLVCCLLGAILGTVVVQLLLFKMLFLSPGRSWQSIKLSPTCVADYILRSPDDPVDYQCGP